METVWIRRHGFPYRPTFEEFSRRFRGLFNVAPDGGVSALIDSVLAPYGSHNWYLDGENDSTTDRQYWNPLFTDDIRTDGRTDGQPTYIGRIVDGYI
ncbi:hypothetical protein BV898_17492 [Hypsibius exemplaris]|uniref:Uncharacterized protein n=1 Tax=Hypsibius exemplaris TaxID=2072580 RepID=A0A9X6NFM9_HYPEX|nr:hypothetical protein BV898_17492 [Hypsibius exemplaris]